MHAIAEDRHGHVWIGTGDGLDVLDPASGQLRHFRHASDDPASLPGNRVRALHLARDGTLWVGTHAGLSRVVEAADGSISFAHPLDRHAQQRPWCRWCSRSPKARRAGCG